MKVALFLASAAVLLSACGHPDAPKFIEDGDPPNTACEKANVCSVWGWCGDANGTCVAVSDEKCRASRACRVSGLCSFVAGRCLAKTSDDCTNSQYCKENGLCSERENVCK